MQIVQYKKVLILFYSVVEVEFFVVLIYTICAIIVSALDLRVYKLTKPNLLLKIKAKIEYF